MLDDGELLAGWDFDKSEKEKGAEHERILPRKKKVKVDTSTEDAILDALEAKEAREEADPPDETKVEKVSKTAEDASESPPEEEDPNSPPPGAGDAEDPFDVLDTGMNQLTEGLKTLVRFVEGYGKRLDPKFKDGVAEIEDLLYNALMPYADQMNEVVDSMIQD